MNDVTRRYWAEVVCNNDFICVDTFSGYRGGTDRDPKGKQNLLPPDASNAEPGPAVLDSLAHSRWALPALREGMTFPAGVEFDMSICDYKTNYPVWMNALMERYGYRTKRALFRGMKNVGIANKNGVLTFIPFPIGNEITGGIRRSATRRTFTPRQGRRWGCDRRSERFYLSFFFLYLKNCDLA
jgi:hypothetical protein